MDDDQLSHHFSHASSAHPLTRNKSVVFSFLPPSPSWCLSTTFKSQKPGTEQNSSGCQVSTMGLFRRIQGKIKHRDNQPQNADLKDTFDSDRHKISSSAHSNPSALISHSDQPHEPSEQKNDTGPKDLWQIAYEKLGNEDQQFLSAYQLSSESDQMNDYGKDTRTLRILEEVIRLTKQQYEDYRNGGFKITRGSGKEDINIRDTAHKILDATLSFKDIISATAAFDPTNHASSAWAIVSLGLTMTKNHMEIRDALFRSSEFLADALARCAFIEKNHYHNNQSETKDKIGKALVQVYVSILSYSVRVQKQHKAHLGIQVLESVTAVSDHPIIQIESSIKNDEQALHHWVQQNEHLQHKHSAEAMLEQIDTLINSIVDLHRKLDYFNLRVAEGASFDSYENQYDAQCLPGTREEILQQIKQWGSSVQGQCMFWLFGRAGTGKSTISRTVARMFKEQGQLGATFFFKRGEGDCGNAKRFFSTITRQLVSAIPRLTCGVSNAIDDDHDISTRPLREQFNKLIFQPLSSLDQSQHTTNMLIVIDALDECGGEKEVTDILELLPQLQKLPSVHWRILLTSKPELPIYQRLEGMKVSEHQDFILHEIPESEIEQDISTFLKHKLSEIRVKREQNLEWPGEVITKSLVKLSVPLFIYAATICRQLEDIQWDPDETLTEILTYQNGSEFEGTYMPVLDRLFKDQIEQKKKRLVEDFQKVVGAIILFKVPLSIASISRLTGVCERLIELRLNLLHSVLVVPDDTTKPVRLFHMSFRDFLLDENTREKTKCWVDEERKHSEITLQCLRVMREGLRKNICKLEHDGTQRIDIDQCLINKSIPPELQYSCRYWIQHLEQSRDPMEKMDEVFSFLQEHFLHWMEVMGILGLASELVGAIGTMQKLIHGNKYSEMWKLLSDAKRFVPKNRQMADSAPLQLYSSGLMFAPQRSNIRKMFIHELSGYSLLPNVGETWGEELLNIDILSEVQAVALSPVGQLLASASDDVTIKLWDPTTGGEKRELRGHSDSVESIAFSHDGQLLASSSADCTIILWDVSTGDIKQTFKDYSSWGGAIFLPHSALIAFNAGRKIKLWNVTTNKLEQALDHLHKNLVTSLTCSPDGKLLASCSYPGIVTLWFLDALEEPERRQTIKIKPDYVCGLALSNTCLFVSSMHGDPIQLWDTTKGRLHNTAKQHFGEGAIMAFSPNRSLVATRCGDDQKTIKLWDITNGQLQRTIQGHSAKVCSIAFSPNGQTLASGSQDKTIRLLDITTPTCELQQSPENHSAEVCTIAFSPDSRLLASGSWDGTIKIWNAKTGNAEETLSDHSRSVAFSPDGQTLASGSSDGTVKLWDLNSITSTPKRNFQIHSDLVDSVAFSPDGQILASGSYDKTVKLTNVSTGQLQQKRECSFWVISVAFSPKSYRLASCSFDGIVNVYHRTLRQKWSSGEHPDAQSVSFSSDGRRLASSSDEATKIWDVESGKLVRTLKGHSHTIWSGTNRVSVFENKWICVNREKVLWLPREYRPTCLAMKDGKLVLGHESGMVSFISKTIKES